MRRDLSLRLLFSSVFLIVVIEVVTSQSKLPFYEAFDYGADQFLHNQAGWSLAYSGTEPVIKSGSLEYPGLPVSAGNKVTFDGPGADPFLVFTTENTPETKVFYSFIIQVTSVAGLNATGSHFAGFQSGTTGGAMIWIKSNGNGGFYIGHSSRASTGISWSSTSYQVNTPLFVAGCYEIVGTYNSGLTPGDDKTYLWVNPEQSSFGLPFSPEPTFVCSMATGTPAKDLADLKSFYIRQDAANTTPFIEMDELRIGLSWKEVTAETTPPCWQVNYPKIEEVTSSAFTLMAGLNEPGKTYFALFPAGAPVPSSAAVITGTGSIQNGSLNCPDENSIYSLLVEGLTRNTCYSIFCIGEDIKGNLQSEPVLISVTTLRSDPPVVSSTSVNNDVDHDFDLVFTEDATWRTAVNDVRVGGLSLTPADWDNSTEGRIRLRPGMGNPLLTKAGIKSIEVIASGYNDAVIEQTINCGAFSMEKSSNIVSGLLHPGAAVTVTLVAKDQYENPLPEYIFKIDAIVTNVTNLNDEVYDINGMEYSVTTEDIELIPASSGGVAEFSILITEQIDAYDGISIKVQLNDGLTDFGSYSYVEPGNAELNTEAALDESTLDEGILSVRLLNETFIDANPEQGSFVLAEAPYGLIIKDILIKSGNEASITFDYDGTDFDSDFSCKITVDATAVAHNKPVTGVFTIKAIIETVPSVTTNQEITETGTTTASWGGNVRSDGGEAVTSKGICWSVSSMPDITGSKTDEDSGTGPVAGIMTGLEPNTMYYVRAYATNIEGTGYGEERIFTTARAAGTEAGLAEISIDGELITGFSKDILFYEMVLKYESTRVPELSYTLSDSRATAVLTEALSVPGSSAITVTAGDGISELTYLVNFTVADPSDDSGLSDLRLDGVTIVGFDNNIHDYTFLLPFGSQYPSFVSATASEYSSVVITQAQSVNGTSVIHVIAQDGISESTYTITFGIGEYIYGTGFENAELPFPGWKASNAAVHFPAVNHAGFSGDYALSFFSGSVPELPGFSGYLKTSMYPNSGKLEFWLSDQSSDGKEKLLIHKRTRESADSVLVAELTSLQLTGNGWNYFCFDIDVVDSTYIIFTSLLSSGSETRLWIDDLSLKGKIITDVPLLCSENKVRIYPNPVHDQLTLEIFNDDIQSFSIFNSSGRKLMERRSSGSAINIDVSSLHDGFYFIRIKVSEGIVMSRFLKI